MKVVIYKIGRIISILFIIVFASSLSFASDSDAGLLTNKDKMPNCITASNCDLPPVVKKKRNAILEAIRKSFIWHMQADIFAVKAISESIGVKWKKNKSEGAEDLFMSDSNE